MIAPGTYVVVGESHAWKSFTLYADGRVEFVDAGDGHITVWGVRSPDGETWMTKMAEWVASGALRKDR